MPRPLRIEFPGACYHVMSRGNARLPIFGADADKELLIDRMVHFAALFRAEIRAYCVMINHVHIHLRTAEANLGAYMRSFLTSFTSMYNHRHGFVRACVPGSLQGIRGGGCASLPGEGDALHSPECGSHPLSCGRAT